MTLITPISLRSKPDSERLGNLLMSQAQARSSLLRPFSPRQLPKA